MELAIVHDLAESIVGDITPLCGITPEEKHRREAVAMKSISKLIPTNNEYVANLYEVSWTYLSIESSTSSQVLWNLHECQAYFLWLG